jgi:Uma2 family endonuclease
MSLPSAHTRYSTEEYLALERESEERHEYLDGQIYAMAGDSPEHGARRHLHELNPHYQHTIARVALPGVLQ